MTCKTILNVWLAALLAGLVYRLARGAAAQPALAARADPEPVAALHFNEAERGLLVKLFHANLVYLAVILAASLGTTIRFVGSPAPEDILATFLSAGVLGSATAALVSCLDRHANGFEDSRGSQAPERREKVGRFSHGMFYWFLARPGLGAITAAIAYWAIVSGVFTPGSGAEIAPAQAAVYGFLAGLLAKSLLSILKGLLGNIFKQ